jgi:hypothetical protein
MPDYNNKQCITLVNCAKNLKKLSNEYLQSICKKNLLFSIFKTKSSAEKIVDSILLLVNKAEFILNSIYSTPSTNLDFLYHCREVHVQLTDYFIHATNVDASFIKMSDQFNHQLKIMVQAALSGEISSIDNVNLNYLDYYLDAVSVGLDCPTNYSILKEQALNLLYFYMYKNEKVDTPSLAASLFESIQCDDRGINQHAKDDNQRFYNIVNLLNLLQYTLILKNDQGFLSKITSILNNALETTDKKIVGSLQTVNAGLKILEKKMDQKNEIIVPLPLIRAYP